MMNNKVQAAASPAAASPPLGLYISRLIEAEYRRRNMFSMIRIEHCTDQIESRLFFMVALDVAKDMLADADEQRRNRELADNIKDAYAGIGHQLGDRIKILNDRIKILKLKRIAEDRPRELEFPRNRIPERQPGRPHAVIASACAVDQKAAPAPVDLATEVCDLPSRLTFLRMLKERTVFGEHAVLSLIIKDYERALRLRTKDDMRGPTIRKAVRSDGERARRTHDGYR